MSGPIYTSKLAKGGNAVVMYVDREIREALGLKPGDMVMMRLSPPYVILRKAIPEREIPMTDISRAMLPPSWPGRDIDVPSGGSKEGTVARASDPDSDADGRRGDG